MEQFLKFLLASCLGTAIAMFLVLFVGISMIAGLGDAVGEVSKQGKAISSNSVLHLELDQPIPELMDNIEQSSFSFNDDRTLGVHDLIQVIESAKDDDKIKGILIETDNLMTGFSSTHQIREALVDFKSSGKFVHAYAPYYSQGAYYLASAADQVSLAPLGLVDFRGFAAVIPFYTEMLGKIGMNTEIFYAGKFKSATEPFRRTSMSPESKQQSNIYLESMYQQMLDNVSETRGVGVSDLRHAANTFAGLSADGSIESGLVDKIEYREEMMASIRESIGLDEDAKVSLASAEDYWATNLDNWSTSGTEIAILVAEGTIVDGKGKAGEIGDETYVREIEKLRKDDDVKAVVFRVNSPGGSAMASDHIWQAIMDLKASGKPVVVSMGDYAASGGYYVACPADSIFAERGTLTGSIGVFSIFPQMQEMLNDKLGIAFDSVRTAPFATGLSPVFNLSPAEKQLLQNHTDNVYEVFLERVSDGRGMLMSEVDEVAQGRVWTGEDGMRVGLVDGIGGIQTAINSAATLADLSDYGTRVYPKPEPQWQRMLKELTGEDDFVMNMAVKEQLGSLYPHYQYLQQIAGTKGVQMRMPFLVPFE